VDTQGDSFFVAFLRAKDAVAAAIDAQHDLAADEWPEGAQLKVRDEAAHGRAACRGRTLRRFGVHRAPASASSARLVRLGEPIGGGGHGV
jgi:hypothetical protein